MAETKKENNPIQPRRLQQTLDMYRNLVEATSDSIYLIDRQCRYLYVNPHHCLRLGVPFPELIGRSYQEFHSPAETNNFIQHIEEVFQQGASFQREHYSERDECEFLRTFSPVRSAAENGRITAVSVISKNITEWKIAERLYATLAERSPIGLFIVQSDMFKWVNKRFQDNTGYTAAETISMSSLSIVHPEDQEHVRTNARAMLHDESIAPYEYRIVTKKGDISWYMGTVTSIEYRGKRAILGSQMDISRQKHAEDAMKQSDERSRDIIDSIADAYYEVDLAGNLLMFNEPYLHLIGYTENEMIGINYKAYANKKHADIAFRAFHQVYKTGKPLSTIEGEIINKRGDVRQVELSVSLFRDAQGKPRGFRGIMSDITTRRKAQEAIRRQAFHDSLTNLANRILFNDRLLMAIKRAKRAQKLLAVMILDLDNFKNVNDRWGHATGDLLLKEVADRLADNVRDTDTVARQGGDEFSIALSSLNNVEDARQIAEKILASFDQPFGLDSVVINMTTSMGIALYPDHGDNFDILIKKADKAMYQAKTLGRNCYCLYQEPSQE